MIDGLFELYDAIAEKEKRMESIVELLGGDMNSGFLLDEIDKLELLIVKALGGNEGHFNHIHSTDLFYAYREDDEEYDREEVVNYIKLTIKNDWTEKVGATLIRG